MLKKRLIGVVTVRNGWAVQSFGYRRYLPLGRPECLVENLDRWGVDEILVQSIDRSAAGLGPDFPLLDRLARLGLSTPLIYGGGIASVKHGVEVVQRGADRVSVDALLQDDIAEVGRLSAKLGSQAIIASLPVECKAGALQVLDYIGRSSRPISSGFAKLVSHGHVSEVMLTDWRNEGGSDAFDDAIEDAFDCPGGDLILFGGITGVARMCSLLERERVAAIAIGNSLSYREHAVQQIRKGLRSDNLRPSTFAEKFPLLRHD